LFEVVNVRWYLGVVVGGEFGEKLQSVNLGRRVFDAMQNGTYSISQFEGVTTKELGFVDC
jgi:hypothetical protein